MGITVRDLLLNRVGKHHVFPRKYLQQKGVNRGRYNQIANFVIAQTEINISIGHQSPEIYFHQLTEQINSGVSKYGGILDFENLKINFEENCLPQEILDGNVPEYDDFLLLRRRLMALRIKKWFETIS